jgi:hypothetical protein
VVGRKTRRAHRVDNPLKRLAPVLSRTVHLASPAYGRTAANVFEILGPNELLRVGHARNGSKPPRITFQEQSALGRAEFFALPHPGHADQRSDFQKNRADGEAPVGR